MEQAATEVATDLASPTTPTEPRLVVDARGQLHHQDSRGRFVKQSGSRAALTSAKLTYGKHLLPGIDGRSLPYQRYRAIVSALAVDAGGVDMVGAVKAQLIRRFAAASVLSEQLEARIANGEEVNVTEFSALSSTLVRLAQRIGIDRVAKEVTGLGAARMLEHQEMMQEEAAKRERVRAQQQAAVEVEASHEGEMA
jgi:hypothetical protein